MKLKFEPNNKRNLAFGALEKTSYVTVEDTAGQCLQRVECKNLQEVETKIDQLRLDLDRILEDARAHFSS
jgi:hypothetical protein